MFGHQDSTVYTHNRFSLIVCSEFHNTELGFVHSKRKAKANSKSLSFPPIFSISCLRKTITYIFRGYICKYRWENRFRILLKHCNRVMCKREQSLSTSRANVASVWTAKRTCSTTEAGSAINANEPKN